MTDGQRLERLEAWIGELVRIVGASTGLSLPRLDDVPEPEPLSRLEAWADVAAASMTRNGVDVLTLERRSDFMRPVGVELLERAALLSSRINGVLGVGLRSPFVFLDEFEGHALAADLAFRRWADRSFVRIQERVDSKLRTLATFVEDSPELFHVEAYGAWLDELERALNRNTSWARASADA